MLKPCVERGSFRTGAEALCSPPCWDDEPRRGEYRSHRHVPGVSLAQWLFQTSLPVYHSYLQDIWAWRAACLPATHSGGQLGREQPQHPDSYQLRVSTALEQLQLLLQAFCFLQQTGDHLVLLRALRLVLGELLDLLPQRCQALFLGNTGP